MCDYKQLGAEYQNDRLGLSSDIMPTLIGWKSMLHVSIKHATLLPFKNKVCLIINVEKQCVENLTGSSSRIKLRSPCQLCFALL